MIEELKSRSAFVLALSAHKDALERLGVRHLALFGSRVRGDGREDSDLDALVDLVPPAGRDSGEAGRIAAARAELAVSGALSEICGVDVSVIERNRLPPQLARRIADDLVEVF